MCQMSSAPIVYKKKKKKKSGAPISDELKALIKSTSGLKGVGGGIPSKVLLLIIMVASLMH